MYRFEGKRILLNNLYVRFKELKDLGYTYTSISSKTGYTRQYIRGLLVKYKYQNTIMETKNKITKHDLNNIIERIEITGNVSKSIIDLKEEKIISNDFSNITYRNHLQNISRYKKAIKTIQEAQEKAHKEVLKLANKGLTYNQISTQTGFSVSGVYAICNKNGKTKKSKERGLSNVSAKSIVDYWNKTSFEGKTPTLQTIKAFKLLGLTPPTFNY